MPPLARVAAYIDAALDAHAFAGEPPTVFVASGRPVARLGLALEPGPELAGWVDADGLDAVFLHRPWRVADAGLPAHVGVLASHADFDHRLTIGWNADLARELGLRDARPFGERDGRPMGMLGDGDPADPAAWIERITAAFGGVDDVLPGRADVVRRVAAVGAMTDVLVRQAAAEGASLYVTGQIRQPGVRAAAETGMCIVAVGHARSEVYGLRLLAAMIQHHFGDSIACLVHPHGIAPAHP